MRSSCELSQCAVGLCGDLICHALHDCSMQWHAQQAEFSNCLPMHGLCSSVHGRTGHLMPQMEVYDAGLSAYRMAFNIELPVETVWSTASFAICRPGACAYHNIILMLSFLFSVSEDVSGNLLPHSRLLLVQQLVLVLVVLQQLCVTSCAAKEAHTQHL